MIDTDCHWWHYCLNKIPAYHRFNNLYFLNFCWAFENKQRPLLVTILFLPFEWETTHEFMQRVIDSLINEEALWVTNEEKLDEKKPPWLDSSVIADVLVVKGRVGVGVIETPTDILPNWLDTLGLNDVDSGDDGDILWLRVDVIVWGAAKYQ